jgi:hypothetical protein
MSYKWSKGISAEPNHNEMADYWETACLLQADKAASVLEIRKAVGIGEDIQEPDDDEQDIRSEDFFQKVVNEVERRRRGSKGNYPFRLVGAGERLSYEPLPNDQSYAYLYLLAATRLNMKDQRVHDGIDGALLFEKVCAVVLKNYFGKQSRSFVFGTGAQGGFHSKLEMLAQELSEITLAPRFKSQTYSPNDDDLDVVTWIPFADGMPSNLICFAQSKTGTSWESDTNQLQVGSFIKRWVSTAPALDPIKAFMVTDSVVAADFRNRAVMNLFFDRSRISEYMNFTDEVALYAEVVQWTRAALAFNGITL